MLLEISGVMQTRITGLGVKMTACFRKIILIKNIKRVCDITALMNTTIKEKNSDRPLQQNYSSLKK